MAGKRCSCTVKPRTVSVAGHWRELSGKKKRKKPAPRKPPASYFEAESNTGRTCGHHHRSALSALSCVKRQAKRDRIARARLTRKQARATRAPVWSVRKVTT